MAVATAATVVVAIAGVIYGAGRMSNAIESMADAIKGLVDKVDSLFSQNNNHEMKIALLQDKS